MPDVAAMRLLVLCTHNSARSQMAEGWLRHHATLRGLSIEVWSAGTVATHVKVDAVDVMAEVGIDISLHRSKTLWDLPDPWRFDLVWTVCDAAHDACPVYPVDTRRAHRSFRDPTGAEVTVWREVRDAIGEASRRLLDAVAEGRPIDGLGRLA